MPCADASPVWFAPSLQKEEMIPIVTIFRCSRCSIRLPMDDDGPVVLAQANGLPYAVDFEVCLLLLQSARPVTLDLAIIW